MPPPERLFKNSSGKSMQAGIAEELRPTASADEINSSGLTYFVDEEGKFYYQPEQSTSQLAPEEDVLGQDQGQMEKTALSEEVTSSAFQTVTFVPSENNNGELSYVLVMQDEGQQPISVDIKEEKTADSYKFEDDDEEDDAQPEPVVKESKKKKKKRKVKGARHNFTCTFCSYSSERRYLLIRHMRSHSQERPHKCTVCDRRFKTLASLQNHLNMHNGVKPHVCRSCGTPFTTSGELVRHVRYKHTHEKPHKCTECDYASVELSKLRRHIRCHTGERPYQCSDCTYASPDTFKLKRHQRIHAGQKPFKCDQCSLSFTQSNTLKCHQLIHNIPEKPVFTCELCPAKCGRKADLRIHIQKQHTSDKPYKCKQCGKSLPDRYSLKMHKKTHVGERRFKCDICPYAAATVRHLMSHMLKHTDEKPFACEKCDQSFRQKQLLRRHENLYHNPNYKPKPPKEKAHSCNQCDRTFARKGNLIRHLAMHDPDSGYQEQALALKIGRQKKVKYIDAETIQVLQDEGQTNTLKVAKSELKRGEVVNDNDGKYVVLEVIQLADGSDRHVAVVVPESKDGLNTVNQEDSKDNNAASKQINIEVIIEKEEEEDMQTKMQKHREDQEKAAAERSLNLENEVNTCFGFDEDQGGAADEYRENVIYELV